MIPTESLMLIALGLGLGLLVALVLGRALWIVLEKSRTRRARRTFPIEISNLQAERDRVQTQAVLTVRRLEEQLEGAKALMVEQSGDIARQRNHIDALTEALALSDRELVARTAALAVAEDRVVSLGLNFNRLVKADAPGEGETMRTPDPADSAQSSEQRLMGRISKLVAVSESLQKDRDAAAVAPVFTPGFVSVTGPRREGLPPADLFRPVGAPGSGEREK